MPAKAEVSPETKGVKDDGRTPVRRGDIYCSPRCGGNCKYAAFQQATADAQALADRLGPGWSPRVWENLGWHFRVKKGVASIDKNQSTSQGSATYTVCLKTAIQFIVTANTPEDAIGFAVQNARTLQRRIDHDLADILAEEATHA